MNKLIKPKEELNNDLNLTLASLKYKTLCVFQINGFDVFVIDATIVILSKATCDKFCVLHKTHYFFIVCIIVITYLSIIVEINVIMRKFCIYKVVL